MKQFLEMYREQDIEVAIKRVYNKSPKELNLDSRVLSVCLKSTRLLNRELELNLWNNDFDNLWFAEILRAQVFVRVIQNEL